MTLFQFVTDFFGLIASIITRVFTLINSSWLTRVLFGLALVYIIVDLYMDMLVNEERRRQ